MRKYKRNSLSKNIEGRLAILLILLFIMLISIYWNTMDTVSENIFNTSQNLVELYKNDIDNKLETAATSLNEVLYVSSAVNSLQNASRSDIYFTSKEVLDILESKLIYNESADAFFIVNQQNDIALVRIGKRVGTNSNIGINQFVKGGQFIGDEIMLNEWTLQNIGEQSAFVKIYKIGETYVGTFVLDSTVMKKSKSAGGSGMVLTDSDGLCFYSESDQPEFSKGVILENNDVFVEKYAEKYMLITENLEQSNGRISNYVERKRVFQGISYLPYGIVALAIATIIYLIYIYVFIREKVISPISNLVVATQKVGEGKWDFVLAGSTSMKELKVLEDSFNDMTKEIENLKIQSYEEQIERQKVELKYLQMQLKPHFYLNAMTTIHSMTYKNKDEQIRAYVEALSEHMRYTIREGVALVPLEEEMRHVKGYVKMQEIRYASNVFLMVDMEKETKKLSIPQFIILTFVENAFKYAMNLEKLLSLFIHSQIEKEDGKECLHIHIEDNGPGFEESVLKRINSKDKIAEGSETGIGIQNIRRTLQLFYTEKADITFSNTLPSGACIDIRIT